MSSSANVDDAIKKAIAYGDSRVKRFSDLLVSSIEDKIYDKEDIRNLINSALLIDAIRSFNELQERISPNNQSDNAS